MNSPYIFPGLPLKHGYAGLIGKLNQYVAYCNLITVDALKSKTRVSRVSRARQVCMYVLKKHTKLTLQEIGDEYKRDHATVMHSIKVIGQEKEYDKELCEFIIELRRELAYLQPNKKLPI